MKRRVLLLYNTSKNVFGAVGKFFGRNPLLTQALILLCFVFLAFVVNRPPAGTFIAGGDHYQLLHPENNYGRYYFAWLNQIGQGSFNTLFVTFPYYFFLGLFGRFVTDQSLISSAIFFFFTYGSFVAFYSSIKLIYPQMSSRLRLGASLAYALNNFTITVFTYPWGYTHHLLYFIFAPPLMALFYKYITTYKLKYLATFAIILTVATMSFSNLAFWLVTILLQLLILVLLLVFRQVKADKALAKAVSWITLTYFVITGPIIFSWFLSLRDAITNVSTSAALGGSLTGWLQVTSSNVLNSFSLAMDSSRFPATAISPLAAFLSTGYFLIIVLLLLHLMAQKSEDKSLMAKVKISSSILLFFVFLSVRIYGAFGKINLFIYQLPLFSFFRSPEKIFSLIPFVYLIALISLLLAVKPPRWVVNLVIILLLVIPYPIYTGGIISALSPHKNDNYHYVTTIPQEYYNSVAEVNKSTKQTAVISLPYSVVNSINWSNYPAWGYVGQDALYQLYNKRFISANTDDNPVEDSEPIFYTLSKHDVIDPDQLLVTLQNFGGEYVLIHRDIDPKWLYSSDRFIVAMNKLAVGGKAKKIDSNDLFSLYRLTSDQLTPVIDVNQGQVTFSKINPTYYIATLKNVLPNETLSLRQSYSSQWGLYALSDSQAITTCPDQNTYRGGQILECDNAERSMTPTEVTQPITRSQLSALHQTALGYANSWTISPEELSKDAPGSVTKNADGTVNITLGIYFKPQLYVNIFYTIYVLTILGSAIYLLYLWRKKDD